MIPASIFLRNALCILIPFAAVSTAYLYLYPIFQGCAFPLPNNGVAIQEGSSPYLETLRLHAPSFLVPMNQNGNNTQGQSAPAPESASETPPLFPTRLAPFRLLAIGDPQLEGDSSIPNSFKSSPFPHLVKIWKRVTFRIQSANLRQRIRWILHDLIDFCFEDIPDTVESIRKRIDHFGNDLYLALVYRAIHWWTKPTHVTVLGDLVGSQWIDDKEFAIRGDRFWNTVFAGSEKVPEDVMVEPAPEYDLAGFIGTQPTNETEAWERRLINVAGNHDIGYAGDLTVERLARFEKMFGKANYELRFEMPVSEMAAQTTYSDSNQNTDRLLPELRIVIINNMNLDTPARSPELQDATYRFINQVITTSTAVEYKGHFTILLTHIPLYKPEGVCVDPPFFDFWDVDHGGGVKEQNQLSGDASRGFLEGIFGMSGDTSAPGTGRGRPGVILNGHDHEGCDTFHYVNQTQGESRDDRPWEVRRWRQARHEGIPSAAGIPGIREITVRSIMGMFGGYTGLLSAWFDEETWEWQFEYATCHMGTHNIWWTVHAVDIIVLGGVLLYPLVLAYEATNRKNKLPIVPRRDPLEFRPNGKVKISEQPQR